jgi:hypothetical protein
MRSESYQRTACGSVCISTYRRYVKLEKDVPAATNNCWWSHFVCVLCRINGNYAISSSQNFLFKLYLYHVTRAVTKRKQKWLQGKQGRISTNRVKYVGPWGCWYVHSVQRSNIRKVRRLAPIWSRACCISQLILQWLALKWHFLTCFFVIWVVLSFTVGLWRSFSVSTIVGGNILWTRGCSLGMIYLKWFYTVYKQWIYCGWPCICLPCGWERVLVVLFLLYYSVFPCFVC